MHLSLHSSPLTVAYAKQVDGHTYERSAIEQWLETHNISPATGLELDSKQLIPNHRLRSLIRDFHEAARGREVSVAPWAPPTSHPRHPHLQSGGAPSLGPSLGTSPIAVRRGPRDGPRDGSPRHDYKRVEGDKGQVDVRRVDEILSMRVDAKRAADFPRADRLLSQLRGMGTLAPPPAAPRPHAPWLLARVRVALAAIASAFAALAALTAASPCSQVWR